MICRRDLVDLFHVLLAFDVDLQQCDEHGRTVMHDACWASNPSSFEIAKCLLQKDPNLLFMFDERGMHPLGYGTSCIWDEECFGGKPSTESHNHRLNSYQDSMAHMERLYRDSL